MINNYIIKVVIKRYLTMSILAMIAATVGMFIDGVIIANFMGAEAMAAFGVAGPVFMIFGALAGVLSNGSVSVCGKYIGRHEPEKVNLLFTTILYSSAAISLLLTLLTLFFAPNIAAFLCNEEQLIQMISDYILGLGIGVIPMVIYQILLAFIRTDGNPRMSLTSIIGMTIVNIALCLLNVYVLKWGLFGMALATSISYAVACLICCTHFFSPANTLHILSWRMLNRKDLNEVLITGSPNAMLKACVTTKTVALNYILGMIGGSVAISALSIQGSINTLLGSVAFGVGSTTLLICGIFYGEQDKRMLENSLKLLLKTGFILSLSISAVTILLINPLIGIFGNGNMEVAGIAVEAILFYLISLPLYTISVIFLNYYQSTASLKMANFICIGDNLLFMLFFVVLLAPFIGLNGVWYSFVLGELLMFLALALVTRLKIKRWPVKLVDFMFLPNNFAEGSSEELVLEYSVRNDISEISRFSKHLFNLCKTEGIDSSRTYYLSLCIEEMMGNIVKYAFREGEKHFIDVRILIKTDSRIILRIRDDGKTFNPLTFTQSANNPFSNIGIKLVKNISKSIDYQNIMGLNNLIIVI